MIIETCPKCGHDLQNLMLTTYPPIPQKKCFNCGWEWTGKREEIIRVPFNDGTISDNLSQHVDIKEYSQSELVTINDFENLTAQLTGTSKLAHEHIELDGCVTHNTTEIPLACQMCSNHPSNGGSGVCSCTMGATNVTC